jgi:N-acetylneuraminic acid mutarotase
MKPNLPIAGLAALFLLTALHASDVFRLETQLYIYKTGDFRETTVSMKTATKQGRCTIVTSPGIIDFDQVKLSLDGTRVSWSSGRGAPKQFSPSGATVFVMKESQPASVLTSAPVQYMERQPDGSLKVRELPFDSPEAPHCRLTFTAGPSSGAREDLLLTGQFDIASIRARENIPGVELEVGKPLLAVLNEEIHFAVGADQWAAVLLPAPNGGDYSMLLLLKASSSNAPKGVLSRVADYHLKAERFGAAAVAEGNYVYAVGGQNYGGFLGDIERFDVRTHDVTTLTKKLTPRHHHGAALVGGKIYVFGGRSYRLPHQAEHFDGSMDIYDLKSGEITHGAPMPTPRAYFASAVVNGKIYAIGGTQMRGLQVWLSGVTEVYDPAANAWTELAPIPTARETRSAAVFDGCILVLGGHRPPMEAAGLKTVESFVPGTNQWLRLPDLSEPIGANSAAALGDSVYLFGNYDPGDEVLAYDMATHASAVFKRGFIPASQSAAVALDDSIYVIGGTGGGGSEWNGRPGFAMDDIQVFSLSAESGH